MIAFIMGVIFAPIIWLVVIAISFLVHDYLRDFKEGRNVSGML